MSVPNVLRAHRRKRIKPKIKEAAKWAYIRGDSIDSRVFRKRWMQETWEEAFKEAEAKALAKEKKRREQTDAVSEFMRRLAKVLFS